MALRSPGRVGDYVGVVRYAGVEYEVRHEHLIDRANFDKAAAILAAHNHAGEKST